MDTRIENVRLSPEMGGILEKLSDVNNTTVGDITLTAIQIGLVVLSDQEYYKMFEDRIKAENANSI